MNKKKIVLIIISIWFLVLFAWVAKSEYTLKGQEILLKTIPVDPRDLFMGDYVILNYEIGQFKPDETTTYKKNSTVYSTLELNKNNIAQLKKVTFQKPQNELFIKGQLNKCETVFPLYKNGQCIKYGIESYYVKEGTGKDIERRLQNGALVKVAVDKNGNAKVKGFVKK